MVLTDAGIEQTYSLRIGSTTYSLNIPKEAYVNLFDTGVIV